MAPNAICHYKQPEGFLRSSNGPLGSKHKIFVGFAPSPFARVKPDSCRELDREVGGEKRWILTGERWGHQFNGVSKQKLCVLWLVVDQSQLQIVKVRPYEGEIDRLIRCHNDHLSMKGCVG